MAKYRQFQQFGFLFLSSPITEVLSFVFSIKILSNSPNVKRKNGASLSSCPVSLSGTATQHSHIFSSDLCVLDAHHIFFDLKNVFNFLLNTLGFLISFSENFKFPIILIFFAPKIFRYFFVSLFCGNVTSKFPNKFFDKDEIEFHLLNDFCVILAFNI